MADESGGDAGEGQEAFGFAFVAAVEAAADAQPGDRSFYHPAVAAQPLGGLGAAAGDARGDAAAAQAQGTAADDVDEWLDGLTDKLSTRTLRDVHAILKRSIRQAQARDWRSVRVDGDTKTEKSRRTLELPQQAADALRKHHKRQAAERLKAGKAWQNNNLVFCSSHGTALDATNVRHTFRQIAKKAKIGENWTPENSVTHSSRS